MTFRLTKKQRAEVRQKYGGRCAYCGEVLGERWHADHLEPVERELKHVRDVGLVQTGRVHHPERDCIENMMPACPPCNNYKHNFSLEHFRRAVQGTCRVLMRNQSTYRHAMRFGLVQETGAKVVFHFEAAALAPTGEGEM